MVIGRLSIEIQVLRYNEGGNDFLSSKFGFSFDLFGFPADEPGVRI